MSGEHVDVGGKHLLLGIAAILALIWFVGQSGTSPADNVDPPDVCKVYDGDLIGYEPC